MAVNYLGKKFYNIGPRCSSCGINMDHLFGPIWDLDNKTFNSCNLFPTAVKFSNFIQIVVGKLRAQAWLMKQVSIRLMQNSCRKKCQDYNSKKIIAHAKGFVSLSQCTKVPKIKIITPGSNTIKLFTAENYQ
jgi:hypothetical protein